VETHGVVLVASLGNIDLSAVVGKPFTVNFRYV
jgi:hypothetical protein